MDEVIVLIEREVVWIIRTLGGARRQHESLRIDLTGDDAASREQEAAEQAPAIEANVDGLDDGAHIFSGIRFEPAHPGLVSWNAIFISFHFFWYASSFCS
jgi:hypothetical protein